MSNTARYEFDRSSVAQRIRSRQAPLLVPNQPGRPPEHRQIDQLDLAATVVMRRDATAGTDRAQSPRAHGDAQPRRRVSDPGRFGDVIAVGLDETLFARVGPYRTLLWSTQIVDVQRGQLLDMVPGRDTVEPCAWFAARPQADQQLAQDRSPTGAPSTMAG